MPGVSTFLRHNLDSFLPAHPLHSRIVVPRKPFMYFLLWLLAGVLVIGLAMPLDSRMSVALDVSNNPPMHRLAMLLSKLGEGWVPALAGFFFAILFMLRHRPTVAAKIVFVVLTCELTGVAGVIVRTLTGRTRPSSHIPQGFYGLWHDGHWTIGKFDFAAFPSGHSATAVGLAMAAWLVHRGWGAVAAVFALGVMWSRIALQSHHLSDVVAAVVLAVPVAMLSKRWLLPCVEREFEKFDRKRQKQ
jgi:membrane-associated phospholipid phosphatase